MKYSCTVILFFSLSFFLGSCKKDNNHSQISNKSNIKTVSKYSGSVNFGNIHNEMLDYYFNKINENPNAFFNNLSDTSNFDQLFSEKLNPFTIDYINTQYPEYSDYNLSEFLNCQYDSFDINITSDTFQSFFCEFKAIIESYGQTTDFSNRINDLRLKYEDSIQNETESMAIFAGCSVVISSQQYWSANIDKWDELYTNNGYSPFNPAARASTNDIIFADGAGAVGGIIRGGLHGVKLGPGGATAGVMIGFVAGAAYASAQEYGIGRIKDWLGF